ncbi:hypothetical protein DL546_006855 [Coniochaeta pulveracea]|uniref:Uncharacterized protein n=1 Tax=Coniochaeta pulveracea TaxID=177199 RepID=A0A420YD54_9PEZI|nr:hypothetical protein DL546_006855 [Coniochaeta pulveracea]
MAMPTARPTSDTICDEGRGALELLLSRGVAPLRSSSQLVRYDGRKLTAGHCNRSRTTSSRGTRTYLTDT